MQDNYLRFGNNQELVLNIFRWLANKNPLECHKFSVKEEIKLGDIEAFSITLSNPHGKRLEFINCLLESDPGVKILESQEQVIRSLAPYKSQTIQWKIQANEIGDHQLKLSIDFLKNSKWPSLFFDVASQFQCIPNIETDIVIHNSYNSIPERLEVNKPVEVKAVFHNQKSANLPSVRLRLETSLPSLKIDPINTLSDINQSWKVVPQKAGEGALYLLVEGIEYKKTRLIQVLPSIQNQIESLSFDILAPLQDKIGRTLIHLNTCLDFEKIRKIPVQICTPDFLADNIYSDDVAEEIKESIQSLLADDIREPYVHHKFLEKITPIFSPTQGCYIPYEPKLAARLVENQDTDAVNTVSNSLLLPWEYDTDRLDSFARISLEQNLAALLLHEQYGHGSFFHQTRLGKQLTILDKHGFVPNTDPRKISAPYPRNLYEEYREVIEALWDSSIVVNEGFATWVELTILPLLSTSLGQATYRRRDHLFNKDKYFSIRRKESKYFQAFPTSYESRYREGYELFQRIQGYFPPEYGAPAVVAAMMKATDVDMGIVENNNEQIQFSLSREQMHQALFKRHEDDARSDKRLLRISSCIHMLDKYQHRVTEQAVISNPLAAFSKLVNEELGW
ncbi:hypothetical protein IQ260_26515 [Leptolyngbya cf. ectocarpi LEGE 11479]|uniref:Uncharacterized protein n=1 Tax=Leptolyngbya cf. ectocarpi LEGE 11479 TaxID=1828722 RepID=A0A928ZZ65_LEPEC|nr:hypothetical protein [Leptolyngbya ectocarpi]MBE9070199.1 hypothetical protein [Leptolyngbya cf. ectocarpi LEGE 11479]